MTETTTDHFLDFAPIPDPLDLSPTDFVAEARRRGLTLSHYCGTWRRSDAAGDIVGIAVVLADPDAGRGDILQFVATEVLGLGRDAVLGLSYGFAGQEISAFVVRDQPAYHRAYTFGRAVCRVAFPPHFRLCVLHDG
jgi:hypothetical protein